jgi:ABC-type dipeptide/oligopeptide/nickel transport system permease subunit
MRVTELFLSLPTLPVLLLIIFVAREPLRRAVDPDLGIVTLIVVVIDVRASSSDSNGRLDSSPYLAFFPDLIIRF